MLDYLHTPHCVKAYGHNILIWLCISLVYILYTMGDWVFTWFANTLNYLLFRIYCFFFRLLSPQRKEIEIKFLQHLLLWNCNFCRFVYSSNRHMKTSYWQLLRCTREEKIESHLSPIIVYLLLWSTTQTIPIVLKVFLPLNSNFSIKKMMIQIQF